MKNNYDKYMSEVFEMKDSALSDYKNSGCASYTEYIEKEMKTLKTKPAYDHAIDTKANTKATLPAAKFKKEE